MKDLQRGNRARGWGRLPNIRGKGRKWGDNRQEGRELRPRGKVFRRAAGGRCSLRTQERTGPWVTAVAPRGDGRRSALPEHCPRSRWARADSPGMPRSVSSLSARSAGVTATCASTVPSTSSHAAALFPCPPPYHGPRTPICLKGRAPHTGWWLSWGGLGPPGRDSTASLLSLHYIYWLATCCLPPRKPGQGDSPPCTIHPSPGAPPRPGTPPGRE